MNNVYTVLNTIGGNGRFLRPIGQLRVTAPHREQANREVTGNFDRGGFSHGACTVPTDSDLSRARLSVRAMRDTHTRKEDGSYNYTSFVVADYENGRFVRLNDRFEARLTRAEYDALLAVGAARPDCDLNHLVLVDVGHLPLFPVVPFNADYLNSKRSLLTAEARLAKLKYLKKAARDFFLKAGITFEGLEPKRERGESDPTKVAVSVPYDKVIFTIEGETFDAVVDDSGLRVKAGRSYQYNQAGYLALCAEIDMIQAVVDSLRPTVRLIEMSLLEHMGDTLTLTVDGKTVTVKRTVEAAVETFYGITPEAAAAFVAVNPKATVKGGAAVFAPAEAVTA